MPQEDRWKLFEWSNTMTGYDDPDLNVSEEDGKNASIELLMYAMGLAAQRREHPEDDIVTKLVQADRGDGFGKLNDDEFGFFVMMLVVAGNETTRNAITHGMRAFFDNPAQWELYKKERPKTAADEIVRWATPIISFQRTAAADTAVGDVEVKAGQRVVMLYSSANYDESVIQDPHTFDISRDPNPHLGVRRRRPALLPGRQSGEDGDQPDVRVAGRSGARAGRRRGRTAAAVGMDQRNQGFAGALPVTAVVGSPRMSGSMDPGTDRS